jgi:hypothetical protein
MTLLPTFIISFDCEGKWGMADKISEHKSKLLTNKNLNVAYERIISILKKHQIKASFAFVGAFTISPSCFNSNKSLFLNHPSKEYVNKWLSKFYEDISRNNFDGWLNPDCINIVAKANCHEIAYHGFTHVPINSQFISEEGFRHELECKKINDLFDRQDLTFVYPRNIVGFATLPIEYGFIGYRKAYSDKKNLTKQNIQLFFDEINLKLPPQEHANLEQYVGIPSGFFLNWRYGLRSKITIEKTVKRWSKLLDKAINTNKVVHLWTHPHNFIDGSNMYELLDCILEIVAERKLTTNLVNLTQSDYAQSIKLLA